MDFFDDKQQPQAAVVELTVVDLVRSNKTSLSNSQNFQNILLEDYKKKLKVSEELQEALL